MKSIGKITLMVLGFIALMFPVGYFIYVARL